MGKDGFVGKDSGAVGNRPIKPRKTIGEQRRSDGKSNRRFFKYQTKIFGLCRIGGEKIYTNSKATNGCMSLEIGILTSGEYCYECFSRI